MNHNSKMEQKRRDEKNLVEVGAHYWGGYFKESDGRIVHIYPYSSNYNRKKWYRRHANRLVRRDEDYLQRCGYKKRFSVMYALY